MTYPDPDDPARPARPSVRPFLQSGPMSAGGYRPTPNGEPPADDQAATLRPFVITSGRTDGADPDIGMETQVTVNHAAMPMRLSPEMRAIVALCGEPHSVAEISARLRLHLGVIADRSANLGTLAYEMTLFATRAGGALSPRLIAELKNAVQQ